MAVDACMIGNRYQILGNVLDSRRKSPSHALVPRTNHEKPRIEDSLFPFCQYQSSSQWILHSDFFEPEPCIRIEPYNSLQLEHDPNLVHPRADLTS